MDHTTDLPALYTTPNGQIVEAETGTLLSEQDAGSLLAATLETYRRAKIESDAIGLRIAERAGQTLEALEADDTEYRQWILQQRQARETQAAIEATLGGLFADRAGKVSIDTPAAKVTWSVGRETWSLAHPASWYAKPGAHHDLTTVLDLARRESLTPAETAEAVLRWLAPTAKAGDLPAPRITLRDGAA